ncbi:hypothetical protein C8R46DRAFT_1067164 [Mycena filopes]|nr:hypothetical protein C8R46DRAFT_1067164 [Mycena filopes]
MNHPYSGAAGYIYANEYPYTPVDAHHNTGPYSKMQSFMPIQSVDSLPLSHPYNPESTVWSTEPSHSHFSAEDDQPRARRDSQRRLLPSRPVAHPYGRQFNAWVDDDSVVAVPASQPVRPTPMAIPTPRPKRTGTTKGEPPVRRSAFVPYEPRPSEERERERDRERRLAAAWRRKIQKRVKRALRRLRRLLEGISPS